MAQPKPEVEVTAGDNPEKQPDKPTETGEVNYQEMIMITLTQLSQKMEETNKKIDDNSKKWKRLINL